MRGMIYTLPELQFVGGTSISHYFYCYKEFKRGNCALDLDGATVDFSIVDYTNKNGVTLVSKTLEILQNTDGIYNTLYLDLKPEDTVDLYNKYVYQISVIDKYGNAEIPNQGILFITKNINQNFIRGVD